MKNRGQDSVEINNLSTCSIAFVDFFLEGVGTHEEARKHHSLVRKELAEKFSFDQQRLPKVVVLMSSTLPPTSELAIFRKETGVRGAFFHTIDKATFNSLELRSRLKGFADGYETANKLNEYMETIETVVSAAATDLASELRSRLDVHDLTILKTLRLDGESDTPQAYLTLLLAEALAARVRMDPALQTEVLPKEHSYGDLPFDGKLLPSSVLFELFADVAVAPVPALGPIKVAFGDVLEAIEGANKSGLLLAISPACDLQRCSPDYEVLCVPGSVVERNASLPALLEKSYSFGHGNLLRITKSMTTNTALVRYPISSLIGELVHGQDGRSYTQAGARWSVDAGGQDARAGGQRRGRGTADGVHMEGPSR